MSALSERLATVTAMLADCASQLRSLDAEFAARKQPILDQQVALLAEQQGLQAAIDAGVV